MRKRQAQSLCPELIVCPADENRDGRAFEPVVAAVTELMPLTEVLRPGLLVLPADRGSRYFGSEQELAERIADVVATVEMAAVGTGAGGTVAAGTAAVGTGAVGTVTAGGAAVGPAGSGRVGAARLGNGPLNGSASPGAGVVARVGIADELFTAVLAARSGQRVVPGEDRAYLADRPIADLALEPAFTGPGRDNLVQLLWRLGLRTLGAFAALSPADVAARFSVDAVHAHAMVRGRPGRRPGRAPVTVELTVERDCDPPIDRIDTAAFLGRSLADELHRGLAGASLACTRLAVHAITERGQQHSRTWRCAQPLTPEATADRIRWQLEGWLTGRSAAQRPDSPVVRMLLEPVEVVDAGRLQHVLTGAGMPVGVGETDVAGGGGGLGEPARRALTRVQSLLGGEAVQVPVRSGGRGPGERVEFVTFGDASVAERSPEAPWPDAIARPWPTVLTESEVSVLDAAGLPVTVTARGGFSAEPVEVRTPGGSRDIHWWAGPWPFGIVTHDDPAIPATGVMARTQVLLDDSRALLLCYRGAGWTVEGRYE